MLSRLPYHLYSPHYAIFSALTKRSSFLTEFIPLDFLLSTLYSSAACFFVSLTNVAAICLFVRYSRLIVTWPNCFVFVIIRVSTDFSITIRSLYRSQQSGKFGVNVSKRLSQKSCQLLSFWYSVSLSLVYACRILNGNSDELEIRIYVYNSHALGSVKCSTQHHNRIGLSFAAVP